MRRQLLWLHKYAGLTLGAVVSLIGVTGSLLVFDHAIDEALTPGLVTIDDLGDRASYAEVLAGAQARVGGDYKPYRIYVARKPGSPHVVRFRPPPPESGHVEVSVAPADARVLAVRTWGGYPMSWLYILHYTLLAGDVGKYTVGALGLLLLFFCVSGIVVWWPRDGSWRRALTIRRGRGAFLFNFDLHKTVGVYLLPVIAVVAFSGVSLVFPDAARTLIGTVLPFDEAVSPRSTDSAARTISVDDAIAAGQRVYPQAELKRVHLPAGPDGTFTLYFNAPSEPWSNLGTSVAWVDRGNGTVLAQRDLAGSAAGSRFMRWQFPLHNGDALGIGGRWLVFVSGLAPALLFGTGVFLWWRKRRNGNLRRARPATMDSTN